MVLAGLDLIQIRGGWWPWEDREMGNFKKLLLLPRIMTWNAMGSIVVKTRMFGSDINRSPLSRSYSSHGTPYQASKSS